MAIEFVGAVTGGTSTSGSQITLDLTALTGGIASSAAENDIVIFAHVTGALTDTNPGTVTSGYAEVADIFANDTYDTNLSVSWKRMGATPDTQVVSNTQPTNAKSVAIAYVFRGVNTTTALDATSTTASGVNTGIPDAPAITPSTTGAIVIAIGAGLSQVGTAITGPSGYSNHVTQHEGTLDPFCHLGIAWKSWSSGTENPGAWSGFNDANEFSWAAVTMALAPVVSSLTVELAANENRDVASFNATEAHTAALTATEGADVLAAELTAAHTASLEATEGADIASFILGEFVSASIDATESADTLAAEATILPVLTAELAATETADTASGAATVADAEPRRPDDYRGGGAPIWSEVSWFRKKKPKKAELIRDVAEVVEQVIPDVRPDESVLIALRLVDQLGAAKLRQMRTLDAFIARVEAEIAEMDDEETLLLAA